MSGRGRGKGGGAFFFFFFFFCPPPPNRETNNCCHWVVATLKKRGPYFSFRLHTSLCWLQKVTINIRAVDGN